MSHGILEILRYFFLALIWLFFLYAVRMVYVEVRRGRESRPRPKTIEAPAVQGTDRLVKLRLRVVEPADRRGRTFELDREVTLGRAPGCAVSLRDDTYASSVHARVFEADGELWVEDLGSRNGTFVNDERLVTPQRLRRGDRVKVGSTLLEVSR